MSEAFRRGLERYLSPGQLSRVRAVRIGIAGAGGLGSNAAMILARCGIEQMLVIDHDIVEHSNLNRQHYWPGQIGLPKVQALAAHLQMLNEHMQLQTMQCSLNANNLPDIVAAADIWLEALDDAFTKKIFVDAVLGADRKVVCASGIAGYGGRPLKKRILGNLAAVGDFETSTDGSPPLAPRVMQAAAMMADCVLEWVLRP